MNEAKQLTEEQRIEKKRRKKQQRRTIRRHCCSECGQPKHYICLEHNLPNPKGTRLSKVPKKIRYYSRKLFFNFARNLGFNI